MEGLGLRVEGAAEDLDLGAEGEVEAPALEEGVEVGGLLLEGVEVVGGHSQEGGHQKVEEEVVEVGGLHLEEEEEVVDQHKEVVGAEVEGLLQMVEEGVVVGVDTDLLVVVVEEEGLRPPVSPPPPPPGSPY